MSSKKEIREPESMDVPERGSADASEAALDALEAELEASSEDSEAEPEKPKRRRAPRRRKNEPNNPLAGLAKAASEDGASTPAPEASAPLEAAAPAPAPTAAPSVEASPAATASSASSTSPFEAAPIPDLGLGNLKSISQTITGDLETVSASLKELQANYAVAMEELAKLSASRRSAAPRIAATVSVIAIVLSLVSVSLSQSARMASVNRDTRPELPMAKSVPAQGAIAAGLLPQSLDPRKVEPAPAPVSARPKFQIPMRRQDAPQVATREGGNAKSEVKENSSAKRDAAVNALKKEVARKSEKRSKKK